MRVKPNNTESVLSSWLSCWQGRITQSRSHGERGKIWMPFTYSTHFLPQAARCVCCCIFYFQLCQLKGESLRFPFCLFLERKWAFGWDKERRREWEENDDKSHCHRIASGEKVSTGMLVLFCSFPEKVFSLKALSLETKTRSVSLFCCYGMMSLRVEEGQTNKQAVCMEQKRESQPLKQRVFFVGRIFLSVMVVSVSLWVFSERLLSQRESTCRPWARGENKQREQHSSILFSSL